MASPRGQSIDFLDHVVGLDQFAAAIVVHGVLRPKVRAMPVPFGPVALEAHAFPIVQQRQQRIRHQAQVAPIHAFDLVDLRGVDVQVRDVLRLAGKFARIAGDAIVEARTERQQAVAVIDGIVRKGRAVHAEHPHRQGVRGIDGADPHQRGDDRQLKFRRKLAQGMRRAAVDDAAARIDERALRGAQCREEVGARCFRHLVGFEPVHPLAVARHGQAPRSLENALPVLHVLRHIEHDRARDGRCGRSQRRCVPSPPIWSGR